MNRPSKTTPSVWSPVRRVIENCLNDGEWHSVPEIDARIGTAITPEEAHRRYVSCHLRPLPSDAAIREGRYRIIYDILRRLGIEREIRGDVFWYRRARPNDAGPSEQVSMSQLRSRFATWVSENPRVFPNGIYEYIEDVVRYMIDGEEHPYNWLSFEDKRRARERKL